VDGGGRNCSSHPGPEEEDQAAPQGPSLRDTQYVHDAYVTMYIAKERNKVIAQVGILTNALLVQYMLDLVQQPVTKYMKLQGLYGTRNKFLP